jgi:hypothetical protein
MTGLDPLLDAYHEAGHVAGGYLHFDIAHQFAYVNLRPPYVRGLGGDRPIFVECIIDLAGPLSEARYSRRPIHEVLARAGRIDRQMARQALERYPDEPEQYYAILEHYGEPPTLDLMIGLARGVVDQRWREICLVASMLLHHERLSSAAVVELLDRRNRLVAAA